MKRLLASTAIILLFSVSATAEDKQLESEIHAWGEQQATVGRKRLFEYMKWANDSSPKKIYSRDWAYRRVTNIIIDTDGVWFNSEYGRVFVSRPYTICEDK